MLIRDYAPIDEPSWLRCRALSFLGSAYYDDVKDAKTRFDGEAIELVAVQDKPDGVCTPGDEQVIGVLDLELWRGDDGTHVATIDTVAVHPDHRRRGIADALLAEGLNRLDATPATLLDAWTREDPDANAWYVRHGFRIDTEYLHVHTDQDEAEGFTSPGELSRPVKAFCHASLEDEQSLRERYARVYRCRRYVRPVRPRFWPDDPKAVDTYDEENSDRDDFEFYLALAQRLGAQRVTDLGCGTGTLAVDLAERGHAVTGVDPGSAILDLARTRPGGGAVTWVHGTAADMPDDDADLVTMTGHVAQYFLTDAEWEDTLRHIHRTLRPGGYVTFESRNPANKAWERCTKEDTTSTWTDPDGGEFTYWVEVVALHVYDDGGAIETHASRTIFPDGSASISEGETLRFRTLDQLTDSLEAAGFTVTEQWGSFAGDALAADSRELILLARKDQEVMSESGSDRGSGRSGRGWRAQRR